MVPLSEKPVLQYVQSFDYPHHASLDFRELIHQLSLFVLFSIESKECPQRGCFNCPLYQSNPLSNPHFKKLQEEANHVRAQHFIRHGLADAYRRVAEL
jgi:hypothetical protein